MKWTTHYGSLAARPLLVLALVLVAGSAGAAGGIAGEWDLTMDIGGQKMLASVSIAKAADGTLSGKWGEDALSDVKFKDSTLTFTRTATFGGQESVVTYEGVLKGDALEGTLSSDQGDMAAKAVRVVPMSPAVGRWAFTMTFGDREIRSALIVSQAAGGALEGEWESQMGEHEVSDLKLEDGKLTFLRKVKFNDREFASTYEGALKGDTLTGKVKSERGELEANATRFGAALIGKWSLAYTSDQGEQKTVLKVFADLSGRLGLFGFELPLKKITLDGDKVAFSVTLTFGGEESQLDFKGKLDGDSLEGESSGSWGTVEVKGKKIVARSPAVGKWEFSRENAQGERRTSTLTIGEDLSGTYKWREREIELEDVKVDGASVSYKIVGEYNGQEYSFEFTGKVEGDELKGTVSSSQGSREVVAKRAD